MNNKLDNTRNNDGLAKRDEYSFPHSRFMRLTRIVEHIDKQVPGYK